MAARRSYGTGNLYARADKNGHETWYARWWADGRQIKRKVGPKRTTGTNDGLTKREAEAKLRELMATVTATDVAALKRRGPSLTDVLDAYIASRDLKLSTIDDYRGYTRNHLEPWLRDKPLHRITPEHVEGLMAHMSKLGLSPKTVHEHINLLSSLLKYAARKGWVKGNAVDAVDRPRPRRTSDEEALRFLKVYEVHDLAAAAVEGPYEALDRTLYLTAALTGLRQGELRGLRWRDVDRTQMRVHVIESVVRGRRGSPKSRKVRSVPLAGIVADALDQLETQSPWTQPEHPVFADPHTGEPIARSPLMTRYRKALTAAGLDPAFRFHDLRHTFGTSMAAAGEPVTNIQAWMGHSDFATTRRYMHYAPAVDESARIDRAFAAGDPRRGPIRGHNMSASPTQHAA